MVVGLDRMNESGRLHEPRPCCSLGIASPHFCVKSRHTVSWRDLCLKSWHQFVSHSSVVPSPGGISTHLATVPTAVSSISWRAARMGGRSRGSIASAKRGAPTLMSSRCGRSTTCSKVWGSLRGSSAPRSLGALLQRNGKLVGRKAPQSSPSYLQGNDLECWYDSEAGFMKMTSVNEVRSDSYSSSDPQELSDSGV